MSLNAVLQNISIDGSVLILVSVLVSQRLLLDEGSSNGEQLLVTEELRAEKY
jgi:hypothetical protein